LRAWKCRSAPSIACSKSLCEKASYQRRSLACQLRACQPVRPAGRSRTARRGSGNRAGGAAPARFLPSCSPMAPIIARYARGLGSRNPEQALEASFSDKSLTVRRMVSSGESFASSSRAAQEIEQRRITLGKAGPCFRPARMNDGVAADDVVAGQAEGAGGNLAPARRLCRESEKIGSGDSRRENAFAP